MSALWQAMAVGAAAGFFATNRKSFANFFCFFISGLNEGLLNLRDILVSLIAQVP